MNGNNAVEAWENRDWKAFYPENFGREGLFINIQSLSVAAFGKEPWALRLPNAIFGILTVLGLYFFTAELFKNKNLALLASFLLATSFWHINFSRIGFRAIMAPFFLTWALYFLLKSLNANRYTLYAAAGGLLYGLGFHSYIAYRATPLLLAYLFWLLASKCEKNQLQKIIATFSIFTVLAALPLGIYFLKNPADFLGRTAGISIFSSETPLQNLGLNILKTAGMFNIAGDFNWRHNVAGRPLLFWPVGILFLIGIFKAIRNRSEKNLILVSWLAVTALPVIISNEGLPHALRSILMAPPVFILSASGGLKIHEFLKPKLKPLLLLTSYLLLLSLLIFEAYYTYFISWGENPKVKDAFAYNDSVIARVLNSLPKETPKYIIVSNTNETIERDNPISLQSILFLTDTFTSEKRKVKSFYYLSPEKAKSIPNDNLIYLP